MDMIQQTVQTVSSTSAMSQLETRGLIEQQHLDILDILRQNQRERLEDSGSLNQILRLVTKLALRDQGSSRVDDIQDEEVPGNLARERTHRARNEPCEELINVITRVCCLVDDVQPQGRWVGKDVSDIKRDLLQTLELLRSQEFLQTEVMCDLINQSICPTCAGRHLEDLQESLMSVHSALSSSRQLMVNDQGEH